MNPAAKFTTEERQYELGAIGALANADRGNRHRSVSATDMSTLNPKYCDFKQDFAHVIADKKRPQDRKTKIVCAIGPACGSIDMIGKLIDAGMNVARLNFSHGDHDLHYRYLTNLRLALERRPKSHVAVLMDTKGPEIRTGLLRDHKPIHLSAGDFLEIDTDYSILGDEKKISCSYSLLPESVSIGSTILVADGELSLTVVECREKSVVTMIKNSCVLEERKNMNLPGAQIHIPGITEKDVYDITNFALVHGVDIVSGSFVRTADNVRAIRKCLGVRGKRIRVHAKIESIEALRNIDEIIEAADGVHVSRGDLGMELEPQQVFLAQKMIISKANIAGKPVVTSTQMLQSMTEKRVPTSAECSDIANAVIDGTDAVMLSAETAKGIFPIESVETMSRVCLEAEGILDYSAIFHALRKAIPKPIPVAEAVASSAVEIAIDISAKLIVAFTETGHTAKLVSKYRPAARIVVVTSVEGIAKQMESLSRGVSSLLVGSMIGTDSLLVRAIAFAKENGWISNGDLVVTVHGSYEAISGHTNIVRVIEVKPTGFSSPSSALTSNFRYMGFG